MERNPPSGKQKQTDSSSDSEQEVSFNFKKKKEDKKRPRLSKMGNDNPDIISTITDHFDKKTQGNHPIL